MEQSFDGETAYLAVIDALLEHTQHELCVFDRDLTRMGLEQATRCETLGRLLASRRDCRLRIVVHDPGPLERNSPRLMRLMRLYPDGVAVRQTPKELRQLADCFLLADRQHGIVRFHAQHARGNFISDDADAIRPWQQRFEELWDAAQPSLTATRLGL